MTTPEHPTTTAAPPTTVEVPVVLLGAAVGDLAYLLGFSGHRLNAKARAQFERTIDRLMEAIPGD